MRRKEKDDRVNLNENASVLLQNKTKVQEQ